jgi:hypothetical protein
VGRSRQRCRSPGSSGYGLERIPAEGGAVLAPNRSLFEATAILGIEMMRLWRQAAEAVAAGFLEELQDGVRRGS